MPCLVPRSHWQLSLNTYQFSSWKLFIHHQSLCSVFYPLRSLSIPPARAVGSTGFLAPWVSLNFWQWLWPFMCSLHKTMTSSVSSKWPINISLIELKAYKEEKKQDCEKSTKQAWLHKNQAFIIVWILLYLIIDSLGKVVQCLCLDPPLKTIFFLSFLMCQAHPFLVIRFPGRGNPLYSKFMPWDN